ncbi:MAG: T9SS type A sorting domain-containing protein, partial [Cyanobacteria bacterium J06649_11]
FVISNNSPDTNYYEYLHQNPTDGVNYYRIKMLDLDGTYEYSEIKAVEIQKRNDLTNVYPNPNSDGILYIKKSELHSPTLFQIFNLQGQELYSAPISDETLLVDLGEVLPSGTYIVCITSKEQKITNKLIRL